MPFVWRRKALLYDRLYRYPIILSSPVPISVTAKSRAGIFILPQSNLVLTFLTMNLTGLVTWSCRAILVSCVVSVVLSCDYESDKEFVRDVAPPSSNGITIELSDKSDTLKIGVPTEFSYTAPRGGRRLYHTTVFVDEKLVRDNVSESTLFPINPASYGDGLHTLRIEITTSVGNGSLADQSGYEEFKISRSWVLDIDTTTPQKLAITSIAPEDGILVIRWPRYRHYYFQSYVLTKEEFSSGHYFYEWSREITDQDQLAFGDSTFQGGKARYTLKIKGGGNIYVGNVYGEATATEYAHDYSPAVTYEWIDRQNVKVSWRKTPFYKGFAGYSLSTYPSTSFPSTSTKFHTNIEDTTEVVTPDIDFPVQLTVSVGVVVKKTTKNPSGASVALGTTFPKFYATKVAYNKVLDKYFAVDQNNKTFLRIDGTTFAIEQSMPMDNGEFCISRNGTYLYTVTGNIVKRLSPDDLSVLNTYDLNSIYFSNGRLNSNLQVTDNNLLVIRSAGGQYLLRMSDFSLIKKTTTSQSVKISDSGDHLLFEGNIFQWSGTQYDLKGPVATGNGYFRDDTQLMLQTSQKIDVYNLSTLTLSSSTPFAEDGAAFRFDRESDLMGSFADASYSQTYTTFSIYSPVEGRKMKTFRVGSPQINYSQYIILLNNQLICSTGFILPLLYYYP